MTTARDGSDRDILSDVLVPVADAEDATATARALKPYPPEDVTLVYVVEKAGGAPDKTPVEQSEREAAAAFDAFRETFPDAAEHLTYGEDVVETIIDAADDVDADAIVFRPRGESRLVQFLAGDRALRLVTEADRPVVSVPFAEEEQ